MILDLSLFVCSLATLNIATATTCVPLVLVAQIADCCSCWDNNNLLLLDALHIWQLCSTMNFKTVLNDKCFKKYQI